MSPGLRSDPSIAEVRDELQSVLSSRTFRQSRGLAKLLRYVCTQALVDSKSPITEYTIAIDVLGKSQDFKETKDSTVRVEVHRLRRRLADFYEQEGAGHPVRIVIPTGQYMPEFIRNGHARKQLEVEVLDLPLTSPDAIEPEIPPVDLTPEPSPLPPVEPVQPVAPESRPQWRFPAIPRWRAIAAAVALIAAAAALYFLLAPSHPLDAFWRPVFSSPNPILLCMGTVEGGQRPRPVTAISNDVNLSQYHNLPSKMVLVWDAATASRFAGLLQAKGKRFRVVSQSEATFQDLQSGPAVLVGLANNDWTERLVGKLPYYLEREQPGRLILRDRQNPARRDWSVDFSAPYLSLTRDYAIVVRVLDPNTEQMTVIAAGITAFGTVAAGEFLTDPQEFVKIEAIAPRGWQKKNFELVLSTDVIRGNSGRPHIVASRFW